MLKLVVLHCGLWKKQHFDRMLDSQCIFVAGMRALYKGLGPTVLRTFPATGGLFLAYETTKKTLSNLAYGHRHDD
jgi:hypothetical protein